MAEVTVLDPKGEWTADDLQALTIDELVDLKYEVDALADEIAIQIETSKQRRKETGKAASADWFRRAQSALKHARRKRQLLQNHIADRRRAEKKQTNESARCAELFWFKRCAKEILAEATYKVICQMADEKREASTGQEVQDA